MKFLIFYLKVVKHMKQENTHMILAVYVIQNEDFLTIGHALRNLVPFVQFKKYEKHPWRSVTVSRVAG